MSTRRHEAEDMVRMKRVHFEVKETAVTILGDEQCIPAAVDAIFRCREILEEYLRRDPFFGITLEPHTPDDDVPPLIRRMSDASRRAGVGPMASVAGIIAEEGVRAMVKAGAENAVIDNGGDIAMFISRPIRIGIYAGDSVRGLGFECMPRESIFGICTSSGTVGPSLSFGMADAATTIGEDVALADACATRLGNEITDYEERTFSRALDVITSIEGIEGAMAIAGGRVAMKGKLPRLVRLDGMEEKVARRLFTRG